MNADNALSQAVLQLKDIARSLKDISKSLSRIDREVRVRPEEVRGIVQDEFRRILDGDGDGEESEETGAERMVLYRDDEDPLDI